MDLPVEPPDQPPRHGARRFVVALLVLFGLSLAASLTGATGRAFGAAGLSVLPFALLAGLAYVGEEQSVFKVLALALLGVMVGVAATGLYSQSMDLLRLRAGGELGPDEHAQGLALIAVMGAALFLAAAAFIVPVRRVASGHIPIDPDRFTHTVALSLTVGVAGCSLAPLVVLGEPVLTAMIAHQAEDSDVAADLGAQLYHLYWLVPVSVLAVGYGIRRTLREALVRLGLVRPTLRQVAASVGIAVLLLLAVLILSAVVDQLWSALGWRRTDQDALERLMGDLLTPAGALVIGISAGLGEELVVRGVLQPRLGLLLSNLLFTALHAGQYNWDVLLIIFALGVMFGLVRKHGNTTMSVIVHAVYDILIVMAALGADTAP